MAEIRNGNGTRDERGRFVPGNPGGGRRRMPAEIRDALRLLAPEAVDVLAEVMRTGKPRERLMAAEAILDRLWGRPAQAVHHLGPEGGIVEIAVLSPEERRARIQELLARLDETA